MTYFDKHIWGYAAVCCLEMIHFWRVYHVVSAQQYQNTKHKWILLGFSLWLSGYFTIWKPWPFLNCIEYRWMMIDLLSLHLDVPVRYNQIFETNPNSMEVSMGKSSNYVAMWRISSKLRLMTSYHTLPRSQILPVLASAGAAGSSVSNLALRPPLG